MAATAAMVLRATLEAAPWGPFFLPEPMETMEWTVTQALMELSLVPPERLARQAKMVLTIWFLEMMALMVQMVLMPRRSEQMEPTGLRSQLLGNLLMAQMEV